jgi:hypothetical protein
MRALTIISRKQPMTLKFFVTVSVLAAAPIVALAQQDFNSKTWVPTIGDAQKLVETISSDKDKLKAYCEIGKLDEQLDKVEKRGDETEFEALVAKRDTLEQQLGSITLGSSTCWGMLSQTLPKVRSSAPYSSLCVSTAALVAYEPKRPPTPPCQSTPHYPHPPSSY